MKQQSKQNNLDAPWLEQMRQEMSDCTDFGTTLPADGWDKIAAQVNGPSIAPAPKEKHRRPLILWISAAASFLLLMGVGIGYLVQNSEVKEDKPQEPDTFAQVEEPVIMKAPDPIAETTPDPTVETTTQPVIAPDVKPKTPAPTKANPTMPAKVLQPVETQPLLAQTEVQQPTESTQQEPADIAYDTQAETAIDQSIDHPAVPDEKETQQILDSFEQQLKSAEEEVLMAMSEPGEKRTIDRSWRIGVAMDGGSSLNADEVTETGNPLPRYESIATRRMTRASDGGSSANSSTKSSNPGQKVYSSDHHSSFSLGISVSKNLTQRLSLQSGLVLTNLVSDVTLCNKQQQQQRVQFLGIPLQLNVSLYEKRHWQIYASGGGMYDMSLRCKRGDNILDYSAQQWSVSSAAGAQYMFTRHIGLYIEPHLSYYFDNGTGTEVPTLFTEHPLTFNLQGGIKIRL